MHYIFVNQLAVLKLQLEQEILDFSEGLRIVGVKPAEKIALFAENSCRWLVADQGMQMNIVNILNKINKFLTLFPTKSLIKRLWGLIT